MCELFEYLSLELAVILPPKFCVNKGFNFVYIIIYDSTLYFMSYVDKFTQLPFFNSNETPLYDIT
jgi:hypothetical protein